MAKRKKLTEEEYAVQNVCPVLAIITVREKKKDFIFLEIMFSYFM